ncbi:uncharacterized protein LOC143305317 isoform X2 [Osmia lignaria lignaria]|uniref:uncharacterized protein LOC143305317 isoform X2 n=1 Tax=Osmia lignaria lignaria TaxID=1437193 RepID=UPI00402B0690
MGFGVTTRQGSSPPLRELVIRMCAATDEHIFRVYDRHIPWPSCLDHPVPVEEAAEKGEEE